MTSVVAGDGAVHSPAPGIAHRERRHAAPAIALNGENHQRFVTLGVDGFRKVREGITTVEEILHITGDIAEYESAASPQAAGGR